jgi:rhodanese-related sulfurtransferase
MSGEGPCPKLGLRSTDCDVLLEATEGVLSMQTSTSITIAQLVGDAKQHIENLSPQQVEAELADGNALLVDIREPDERARAAIPNSVHAPRGMLEFYADPASPYHRAEFDPSRRTILYCASGGRSALATRALQQLGYAHVAHMDGGLKAWTEQDRPLVQR